MAKKQVSKQAKISKIEVTSEKLSGRGGLVFFLRYVENIGLYRLFDEAFAFLKRSMKGLSTYQFIKQLLAHFIDGTDMAISAFDRRKEDGAYAGILENFKTDMASSHQIKRMFRKLLAVPDRLYRKILHRLFLWRLRVEKPSVIILFADTMVLDNDDAQKREGVEPTYRRKRGFQPLQISWGPYVVDVLFRRGDTHSNHGCDLIKAITKLTRLIRDHYRDVPIVVLTDSGFLDDTNFRFFEERLKIHYVCVGKQYDDLKNYAQQIAPEGFNQLLKGNQSWQYLEFANRLKAWSKFRRCIFTTLDTEENGQLNFEFTKTDSFIYTNLGQDKQLTEQLTRAGAGHYLEAEHIIALNHQRGKGELTHRSLKEFATKEQLPFERFGMNRAYYYFLVISHFLYEAFKQDSPKELLPLTCYPNTFRRTIIDIAVKIISTGGQVVLKVSEAVFERLKLKNLWEQKPIPIPAA